MHRILGVIATVSAGLLSPAFAMDPPTPAAAPATSAPAASAPTDQTAAPARADSPTAPSNSASTASASATQIKLTAGDAEAERKLKVLTAQGYKPELHSGEIWFCRKEEVVGSRFEQKLCFTASQIEHIAADARQQTDRITSRISGDPRGRP